MIGKAAGGTRSATAKWNPPASTGGTAITGYRVSALAIGTGGAVIGTTTFPMQKASVRSLKVALPAGEYAFIVEAINAIGAGPASACVQRRYRQVSRGVMTPGRGCLVRVRVRR